MSTKANNESASEAPVQGTHFITAEVATLRQKRNVHIINIWLLVKV